MNILPTFDPEHIDLYSLDEQQLRTEMICYLYNITEYLKSIDERLANLEQNVGYED